MTDHPITPLPADDLARTLTVATPDDPAIPHLSQAGNVYTVLISGSQTAGRYSLMDMLVPDGGGPPLHRHDFEEMFTLLDGELEFTFRGETMTVRAPASINIPANAPHRFVNRSGHVAHMLCLCTPPGLEEFFQMVATPVPSRSSPPPELDEAEKAEKQALQRELAARYRTELVV